MSQSLGSTFTSALEALGMSTLETATPAGEASAWSVLTRRFTTRGFLMAWLRPTEDGLHLRADFALPRAADSAAFGAEFATRLALFGARDNAVTESGPPCVVRATFDAEHPDVDRARDMLTLVLKVGDYIAALEGDPQAPSPLESPEAVLAPLSEVSEDRDEVVMGGFETIGAPESTSSSPFETIGSPEKAPREEGNTEITLERYGLRTRDNHVSLGLVLSDDPGTHGRDALWSAMRRILRLRHDVDVEHGAPSSLPDLDATPSHLLAFDLHPLSGDRSALSELSEDVATYARRLIQFGELGVSLFDTLDARSQGSQAKEHRTAKDLPSLRQRERDARSRREEESDSGIILDLGASSSAHAPQSAPVAERSPGSTLRVGDYADERLKRSDATTPLVDVVLRHPGYHDKRIGQVLAILLSIEFHKARRIAETAPCVIAWGIGKERAQTFKDVIEGADGKALLVEPGTFAQ